MVSLLSPYYGLFSFDRETLDQLPYFYIYIDQPCEQYNTLIYKSIESIVNISNNGADIKQQIQYLPEEVKSKVEFYFLDEENLSPLARLVKRLLLTIKRDDLEMFKFFLRKYYYNPYEWLPEALVYLKEHNVNTSQIREFLDDQIVEHDIGGFYYEIKRIQSHISQLNQRIMDFPIDPRTGRLPRTLNPGRGGRIRNVNRDNREIERLRNEINIEKQRLKLLEDRELESKHREEQFYQQCLGLKTIQPLLSTNKAESLYYKPEFTDPDYSNLDYDDPLFPFKNYITQQDITDEVTLRATILYLEDLINYKDYSEIDVIVNLKGVNIMFNLAVKYDNIPLFEKAIEDYKALSGNSVEQIMDWIGKVGLAIIIAEGAIGIYNYILNYYQLDTVPRIKKFFGYLARHFPTPWGLYDSNRLLNIHFGANGYSAYGKKDNLGIHGNTHYNVLKLIPLAIYSEDIPLYVTQDRYVIASANFIIDDNLQNLINQSQKERQNQGFFEIISNLIKIAGNQETSNQLTDDDRYLFNSTIVAYYILHLYYKLGEDYDVYQIMDFLFDLFGSSHIELITSNKEYLDIYHQPGKYPSLDIVLTKLSVVISSNDVKAQEILKYIESHKVVEPYGNQYLMILSR